MGLTHFPNGVSSFGMPMIGSGPILTTGGIYFLSSTSGGASDGNLGTSPDRPMATLDAALGRTTANNGDYIIVMPNHAQTISAASAFTLDVAGVSIIGLGRGTDRPQFLLDVTGSTITADNVLLQNVMLTAGASGVAVGLDVAGAYAEVSYCEFGFDVATDDFVIHLQVDNFDHAYIHHCRFIAEPATAGANTAMRLEKAGWIRVVDNFFTGD